LQTAKRDFKSGCALIVAKQEIGHAQCERVERAASRNAKFAKAGSAQILHGCKETLADDSRCHSDRSGGIPVQNLRHDSAESLDGTARRSG
jgi:hypothetical protein